MVEAYCFSNSVPVTKKSENISDEFLSPRHGFYGSVFLSFSRSKVVMKKSSNDTFFVQKEVLGE